MFSCRRKDLEEEEEDCALFFLFSEFYDLVFFLFLVVDAKRGEGDSGGGRRFLLQ